MHGVLVVMDQSTRRIIGFAVHAGYVDGIALCCMFNTAIARTGVPKHLSSDNDPLFTYHRWLANLHILEIDEVQTVPYTPVSHPFVERLIGSIRRELLDQFFFWNTVDLERKLRSFQLYFNHSRTHTSLDGGTPAERSGSVVTHPSRAAQLYLGKALRWPFRTPGRRGSTNSPRTPDSIIDLSGSIEDRI